jgi:hypothetical protein
LTKSRSSLELQKPAEAIDLHPRRSGAGQKASAPFSFFNVLFITAFIFITAFR